LEQKILIIDDDEAIRTALQLVLENEGYRVFIAENGQEGLELLENIPRPDVILLDLMMPVLDGWEFLELRKKDLKLASIPVVVISAFNEQERKLSVEKFIKKPIDLKVLHENLLQLREGQK